MCSEYRFLNEVYCTAGKIANVPITQESSLYVILLQSISPTRGTMLSKQVIFYFYWTAVTLYLSQFLSQDVGKGETDNRENVKHPYYSLTKRKVCWGPEGLGGVGKEKK